MIDDEAFARARQFYFAEHLTISTDVVGVWLHRARRRLRELLAAMNDSMHDSLNDSNRKVSS